jgi:hypothetical protein
MKATLRPCNGKELFRLKNTGREQHARIAASLGLSTKKNA